MRKPIVYILAALAMLLALSLPAEEAFAQRYRCGNCGTVERVQRIRYDDSRYDNSRYDDNRGRDNRDSGTEGLILGALIGGALGNQVGKGDGRTAATIAGVVAGGAVGRNIDRNDNSSRYSRNRRYDDRNGNSDGVRLQVRMDGGGYRTVEVAGNLNIYRGDRVRLNRDRVVVLR